MLQHIEQCTTLLSAAKASDPRIQSISSACLHAPWPGRCASACAVRTVHPASCLHPKKYSRQLWARIEVCLESELHLECAFFRLVRAGSYQPCLNMAMLYIRNHRTSFHSTLSGSHLHIPARMLLAPTEHSAHTACCRNYRRTWLQRDAMGSR